MHPIQAQLLKVVDQINVNKMSLREIGSLIGESHPQKIKHHLGQLEKKGFVSINKKDGSILLTNPVIKQANQKVVAVPIYGYADCGQPTAIAEKNLQGFLKVSKSLLGKADNIFAVHAQGPSMNKAKVNGRFSIEDGDYILVDPNNKNPQNGDYVLSIIDGAANIKKFFYNKKEQQIALVSESTENIAPIFIHADDNYMINGTIKNVIKSSFLSHWNAMQNSAGRDAIKSLGKMSNAEAKYYKNLA